MGVHADIRVNNILSDRIASCLNVNPDEVSFHIGKYYYNHRKSIDPEHLDIPVYLNRYKLGTYQISLYTGIVTDVQFYTSWVLSAAPDADVDALKTWASEQEGEPTIDEIYALARGLCTGDVVRLDLSSVTVPIEA